MCLNVGFVIQAEKDDEMPERMLGCAKTYFLDLAQAPFLEINSAPRMKPLDFSSSPYSRKASTNSVASYKTTFDNEEDFQDALDDATDCVVHLEI